ncbi:MAG: hypothetical protein WC813_04940 [Patescibacteria group bacterium]
MLSMHLHGLLISINCTTEFHLVDEVLPESEESEVCFEEVLVVEIDQLSGPFDEFLSIAA